jgi:uncharacterized membrane protein YdbT with pleckstrin-like domain
MSESTNINFKPNMRFNIIKSLFQSIFAFAIYYAIIYYFPSINEKIFFTYEILEKTFKFNLLNIFIIVVFVIIVKELISLIYLKLFNNYLLTDRQIIVRSGLFNNKISISLNGRLLAETKQNFFQLIVGLVDIYLEADGDSSSPEAILKNVNPEYFDMINRFKEQSY